MLTKSMKIPTAVLCGLAMLGCRDASGPRESTGIIVTVKLAGVFPFDGFAIRVDGQPMTLLKTEPGLVVTGLTTGPHTVTLDELPTNCQSTQGNQLTVETTSANLSAVGFNVSCISVTGAIAVRVSLDGYDKPLWFPTYVDSHLVFGNVRPNATVTLGGSFAEGPHVVTLSSIPAFCEATGEMSASVNLKTGAVKQDTALASFNIHCAEPQLGSDTAATIAFERNGLLMAVRESGSDPVALTEGQNPSWSRDGKLIAFQRFTGCDDFSCDHDLWLMTRTGDSRKSLRPDQYADDFDPAISPDGGKIAFIRFVPGPDMTWLAVTDLDGNGLRYVSVWSPVSSPSWSPDGRQIAFVCWRDGQDICVVNSDKRCTVYADRCDLTEDHLTTGVGDESDAAWSPDGRSIAFTLECGGLHNTCPPGITPDEPAIAVIDVATRQVTQLVSGHDPAWSPDGSQIVFVGNPGSPGLRIYRLSDGRVRQLTNGPFDHSPSWRE